MVSGYKKNAGSSEPTPGFSLQSRSATRTLVQIRAVLFSRFSRPFTPHSGGQLHNLTSLPRTRETRQPLAFNPYGQKTEPVEKAVNCATSVAGPEGTR